RPIAEDVGLFRFAKTRSFAFPPAAFRIRLRSRDHPLLQSRPTGITSPPRPAAQSRSGEQTGESTTTRSVGRAGAAFARRVAYGAPPVTRRRSVPTRVRRA